MGKLNETVTAQQHRRVYLQCRPIFSGQNAHERKGKKITALVEQSKSLRPLLQDIGKDKVLQILQRLLDKGIFESESRAKAEFPELFPPTPHRDAQRHASELSAARSTAEVLSEISSQDRNDRDVATTSEVVVIPAKGPEPRETTEEDSLSVRHLSLYPTYLPYRSQHVIMNKAQQVLEECCFEFATAFMPELLDKRSWDCPEAAELTQWTTMFLKGKDLLPGDSGLPKELLCEEGEKLLQEVAKIRHTAVHRLNMTAKGVCQLLENASKFAQVLRDDGRAEQLDKLRVELNGKIKAMELNKNVLENKLASELRVIQEQRQKLDEKEAALIQATFKHDLENKALIGQLMEESVGRIFCGHGGGGDQGRSDGDEDDENDSGTEDGREEEEAKDLATSSPKLDTYAKEEGGEEEQADSLKEGDGGISGVVA